MIPKTENRVAADGVSLRKAKRSLRRGSAGNLVAWPIKARRSNESNGLRRAGRCARCLHRMEVDKTRDEVYVSDGATCMAFRRQQREGTLLKKDGKTFNATDVAAGYEAGFIQTGTGFSGR